MKNLNLNCSVKLYVLSNRLFWKICRLDKSPASLAMFFVLLFDEVFNIK